MLESLKSKLVFEDHKSLPLPELNGITMELFHNVDQTGYSFLCTNGLSKIEMEMPKGLESKSRAELAVLFPAKPEEDGSYMEMDTTLLFTKIASLVTEKNSWIGAGHTFPNISDEPTISKFTEMDHFMLVEPALLKEDLSGINTDEKELTFLFVIPLFKKELDFKMKNGAYSLMKRMRKHALTEKFEMKRPSCLKRKFFGL